MLWTVLTGDFIDSTDIPPDALDAAMNNLSSAARAIGQWPGGTGWAFSRRAGDGWQVAIGSTDMALRASLYLVARLRAHDPALATRIAVATGEGEVPEGGDLNSAHGPGFTGSGRLLERMPARTQLSHATPGALRATFLLADHIAQGWTQAQARAMVQSLPPGAGPRSKAARALGISRQAVDQALHAAGFPALEAAMTELEAG